jgi:hypothetical protein
MPHARPGKRKKTPKRVLALPDLEHAKSAVLSSLTAAQKRRPARRGTDWAPPFDACATTHRSPERDRQLQE